jgi:soluble lytic murein transglycosylase-like protein
MSDKDKNYITNLSRAAQIDPETMLKIMAMESGSNPNAISPTGAIGKNQFVGGTADKVGIQDRFDADQNIRGAVIYARDNIQLLKAANLPITAENIYMMHQLGPGAGSEVIKAARDGTPISQLSDAARRGMSRNYGKDSDTAAEYIDANKKALNANYQRIVR